MRKISYVVLASSLLCFSGACAEQKGQKKDDKKEAKKDGKKAEKQDAEKQDAEQE
jgi:hypothetical protein